MSARFQPQSDRNADAALDALGNPVRREIIELLSAGPLAAGDIAKNFEISRPAISKHLSVLQKAQMIAGETVGNRNIYHLEKSGFDHASDWLDHFWSDALIRFALFAQNTYRAGDDE